MTRRGYVLFGLVPLIWFGALNQGLFDYWAMTVAFGWISGLAILTVIFSYKDRLPLRFPLLGAWVLMMAAAWLSSWHSVDVTTTLWEAWGWTSCMVCFYIVVNCAVPPLQQGLFLMTCGSVVVPLTLCAWHQQLWGSPTTYGVIAFHGRTLAHYGRWEIHATLVNSIVFAGFLLSWSLVFWPWALRRSPVKVILFIFLAAGIVLSRSWAACLCLSTGLIFYHHFLHGDALKRKRYLMFLVITGSACIVMLLWKLLQSHEGQNYIPSMRFLYWKAAMQMFWTYPLTGVGLGGYAAAFPFFKHAPGESTLFAHGLLWQIISETGLLGLVACGVALVGFFHGAKRAIEEKGMARENWGLHVTLVTLWVFGMTTIHFDYLLNKLTFVLFAGLSAADFPSRRVLTLKPMNAVLIIVTLVTCASLWGTLFRAEQLYARGDYAHALRLNPRLGVAWAKLADAETNPALARQLRLTAWRWKKDRHFLALSNVGSSLSH